MDGKPQRLPRAAGRVIDPAQGGFVLSFWRRPDFGLICIPGFCSARRRKRGRVRRGGETHELKIPLLVHIKVCLWFQSMLGEARSAPAKSSPQIWTEGRGSYRSDSCVALLCVCVSLLPCVALFRHPWTRGRTKRWITANGMDGIERKENKWVRDVLFDCFSGWLWKLYFSDLNRRNFHGKTRNIFCKNLIKKIIEAHMKCFRS